MNNCYNSKKPHCFYLCRFGEQRSDSLRTLNVGKPNNGEERKVWDTDTRDPGLGDQSMGALRTWGGDLAWEEASGRRQRQSRRPGCYSCQQSPKYNEWSGFKTHSSASQAFGKDCIWVSTLSPSLIKTKMPLNNVLKHCLSLVMSWFYCGCSRQRGKPVICVDGTQNPVKLFRDDDAIYHSSVEKCSRCVYQGSWSYINLG